jgi:hypothetical protein
LGVKVLHQYTRSGKGQPDQEVVVQGGGMIQGTCNEGNLSFFVFPGQERVDEVPEDIPMGKYGPFGSAGGS